MAEADGGDLIVLQRLGFRHEPLTSVMKDPIAAITGTRFRVLIKDQCFQRPSSYSGRGHGRGTRGRGRGFRSNGPNQAGAADGM